MKVSQGFSIIEVLIYIALLAGMCVAIVNTTLVLGRSLYTVRALNGLQTSALNSMERLTREIRGAKRVDDAVGESVFETSPGRLWVEGTDASGNPTRVEFALSGNALTMVRGGIALGSLMTDTVEVTNLVFHEMKLGTSTAVRVEMTLQSVAGKAVETATFSTTVVARGSYE